MNGSRSPTDILPLASVIGVLVIAGYLFVSQVMHTQVLMTELLTPVLGTESASNFRMPSASTFHFVLALEKVPSDYDAKTRPLSKIHGELLISEGTNLVVRIPVDHDDLEPCNWLSREGFGVSYVLGWKAPKTLPKQLTAGHEYRVQVRLQGATNAQAGIWLHCAVPYKDRKSATGMKIERPARNSGATE